MPYSTCSNVRNSNVRKVGGVLSAAQRRFFKKLGGGKRGMHQWKWPVVSPPADHMSGRGEVQELPLPSETVSSCSVAVRAVEKLYFS